MLEIFNTKTNNSNFFVLKQIINDTENMYYARSEVEYL